MQVRRWGSWPVIGALVAIFLVLFWLQRQRSTFLRIEQDRSAAEAVASACGIGLADTFALRDLVGITAPQDEWQAAAESYQSARVYLGDPLAAVAVAGHREFAELARALAGDPDTAWREFRGDPRALPGQRFLLLRERFAARMLARD